MNLIISEEIARRYPDLRVGIVVADRIDNREPEAALEELRRQSCIKTRQRFTVENLADHPHIQAWRDTYRTFGANPKRTVPTVEALMRRVVGGKDLPSISKAVDLYLIAELDHVMPVGGYDLTCVSGDIQLKASSGNEAFVPIGGNASQPELTKVGEIVYDDSTRVLTRMWNYRDCDFAKITEASTMVALFAEAPLSTIPTSEIEALVNSISSLIARFCGGAVRTQIADIKDNLAFEL